MIRSTRRLAVLVLATCACMPAMAAETPARLILGKWRHVSLQVTEDGQPGPTRAARAEAFAEFAKDGTWKLTGATVTSSGTYRWLDAHRLEQRVTDSTLPHQPGMVSIKRVAVGRERLELVTVNTRAEMDRITKPEKPGAQWPEVSVVTSVFARVDAP